MDHKRRCIACGEIRPRCEMIKITKEHTSGNLVIQPNSKIFGRSIYLCYNEVCISTAFKKNRLNKMLKSEAKIDKEDLLKLVKQH